MIDGKLLYPIGSIYMSIQDTNPSVFFGGTWEQIKDVFLLSAGDTYNAGTSGGSSNLQANLEVFSTGGNAYVDIDKIQGSPYKQPKRVTILGNSTETSISENGQSSVSVQGIQDSSSCLPPYLAVYVWKRTA